MPAFSTLSQDLDDNDYISLSLCRDDEMMFVYKKRAEGLFLFTALPVYL